MYKTNIGNNKPGSWRIANYYEELRFLFDVLSNIEWEQPKKLLYSENNIQRTALHLNLPYETVKDWLDDPEFSCYKESVVELRTLKNNQLSTEIREFISNLLGLRNPNIFLQDLKPGGITPWHIDGKKHLEYNLKESEEHLVERHIIFLEDQKPGQIWQINEDFIKWKIGDILTWDQSTSPHGTANIGYDSRPVLMVTGVKK